MKRLDICQHLFLGRPITVTWVYRLGAEKAKQMLLKGEKILGLEAEDVGHFLKAAPADVVDYKVEEMVHRPTSIPVNQFSM